MNKFQVIEFVLCHPAMEGGGKLVNDPHDAGGLTKYGFSKRANPDLDIANLTLGLAIERARTKYWDSAQCDAFPIDLAASLFDFEFNSGPIARKVLQSTLQVKADGIIGPKTIAAAHHVGRSRVPDYLRNRMLFLEKLPTWQHHKGGWIRRLFTLQDYISNGGKPWR
jgi:lysozyme family protein